MADFLKERIIMKYRIFGKDGISDYEHQKLVEWRLIKEKPLEFGVFPEKVKIRKKYFSILI